MIDLFTQIKQMTGPVFVHLRTVKGKGYDPAEANARKWHAVTPPMFADTAAGTASGSKSSGQTWTNVFSKTIIELANDDPEDRRDHRRHARRHRPEQVQGSPSRTATSIPPSPNSTPSVSRRAWRRRA